MGAYTDENNTVAKQFAQVIKNYIATGSGATSTWDSTNNYYTISGLDAGYYLVETTGMPAEGGTTGTEDSGAYTRYMLSVVKSVTLTPKESIPSVDKDLSDVDANIGDTITYYIAATLPSTYADYDTYKLVFHDILSSGLTFDTDSVEVYVFTDGSVYDYDAHNLTDGTLVYESTSNYTVTTGTSGTSTTIDVELTNTKALTADDNGSEGSTITTDKDSLVVVVFTATLNENAVIGGNGNPNEVYLEYSNNPNSGGSGDTGTTTVDKVVTWTYELDVTKVNAADTTEVLSGAKFVLYRVNSSGDYEYIIVDSDNKVTGWTENEYDSGELVVASVLTSNSSGIFEVIGLDQGTYYLKEVEAPTGYNIASSPFTIVVTAEYSKNDSGTAADDETLTTLTITNNGEAGTADLDNGTVSTTIQNSKGSSLPGTGGIGTTIFYVVGGVLALGAVVLLITRKRLGSED